MRNIRAGDWLIAKENRNDIIKGNRYYVEEVDSDSNPDTQLVKVTGEFEVGYFPTTAWVFGHRFIFATNEDSQKGFESP